VGPQPQFLFPFTTTAVDNFSEDRDGNLVGVIKALFLLKKQQEFRSKPLLDGPRECNLLGLRQIRLATHAPFEEPFNFASKQEHKRAA
jgi:hypothetical protein